MTFTSGFFSVHKIDSRPSTPWKERNDWISCEVTSFIISRSISTETLFSILIDLRYCCDLALISSRWILGSRLRSISCRRFISSSFSFVRRLCCSHSWRKKQNRLVSRTVSTDNGVSRKVIIMSQTMYTRIKHRVECFIIERSRIKLTTNVRFILTISKNKKWADKNCANKFLWMKRVWNYYWILFLTNEQYTTS